MYSFILAKHFHKNWTKYNVKIANIHIENLKKKKKANEYWTNVRVLFLHHGLA